MWHNKHSAAFIVTQIWCDKLHFFSAFQFRWWNPYAFSDYWCGVKTMRL